MDFQVVRLKVFVAGEWRGYCPPLHSALCLSSLMCTDMQCQYHIHDRCNCIPEMDLQALRLEFLLAVLAGDLVLLHIAPVLALNDTVCGQHDISIRQLSRVCCALVAMEHHNLDIVMPQSAILSKLFLAVLVLDGAVPCQHIISIGQLSRVCCELVAMEGRNLRFAKPCSATKSDYLHMLLELPSTGNP